MRCRYHVAVVAVLLTALPASSDEPRKDAALRHQQAKDAHQKSDLDRAIRLYSEAVRLDPKLALAFYDRGRAYVAKQDADHAIRDYDEAIRLDPKMANAYSARGYVYQVIKKEPGQAQTNYTEALRLDPKNARALNNLAWLWATCSEARYRDGKKAVEYAKKGCELTTWKDWTFIDTLAAAHAEAGEYDEAVKWQKRVVDAVGPSGGDDARARLRLYEQGKPYREK